MRIAEGRIALVTGAASGFGAGVSERLISEGIPVAAVDIDAAGLDALAARLGPELLPVAADVTSAEAMASAVEAAVARFGALDTLVISAGVIGGAGIETTTEEEWERVLGVNLTGAFLTARAAVPALKASGRGRIVAISSDSGRRGDAGGQAYAASKFGLNGLIESIAAELARDGVTANTVRPIGTPETAMGQAILARQVERLGMPPEAVVAARASGVPLGRNPSVDDTVNAIMFLIADDSSFMTGYSLDVDGGRHLGRSVLTPWKGRPQGMA